MSASVLHDMLDLPADCEIVHVVSDHDSGTDELVIFVDSDQFDEVPVAAIVPEASPTWRIVIGGRPDFVEWGMP